MAFAAACALIKPHLNIVELTVYLQFGGSAECRGNLNGLTHRASGARDAR
jgi:hypothetical protein